MESEDGQIYKSPCVVWPEKQLLLYGSGSVLFIFDLKECKLFNKIEYSGLNQFVRSIYIDNRNGLFILGFDDKTFYIYDSSFDLLLNRTFSKKISFIASFEGNVIVGDMFGDISLLFMELETLKNKQKNKLIDNLKDNVDNNCKIVVPFSHYSTITSSLVYKDLLFTGNKDGKVVMSSLLDLHEIKDIYLSHKMSVSYLDFVEDNLLVSLSIDNSLRFWSVKSGLEVYRILLIGSKCIQYHLNCDFSRGLIVILCLDEILVVNFDFNKLEVLNHLTYRLPFASQCGVFYSDFLYLVDHYSNLHRVKSEVLVNKNSSSHKEEFVKEGRNVIRVQTLVVLNGDKLLKTQQIYKDDGMNIGVKINIKKHIDLN